MTLVEIGFIVNSTIDTAKKLANNQHLATKALAEVYLGVDKVIKALTDAKDTLKDELTKRAQGGGGVVIDGGYEVKVTEVAASPGTVITAEMVGQVINARKASTRLAVKTILG